MVASQTFSYQIPYSEVAVDDNIKKIVISSPNYSNLSIRTEEGSKIASTGSLDITTDSEEKAKELLNDEYIINKKN